MANNYLDMPANLPVPHDDGGAAHLVGLSWPDIALPSTDGPDIQLATQKGWSVTYIYPMTARPNVPLPSNWDEIPGARGGTPQSCAFRDHAGAIRAFGAKLFGLSVQDSHYQQELVARLHLPYPVLSDVQYRLTDALRLPCFEVEGMRLLKRLTLISFDGQIKDLQYPVFPSTSAPDWALAKLQAHTSTGEHSQ